MHECKPLTEGTMLAIITLPAANNISLVVEGLMVG